MKFGGAEMEPKYVSPPPTDRLIDLLPSRVFPAKILETEGGKTFSKKRPKNDSPLGYTRRVNASPLVVQ